MDNQIDAYSPKPIITNKSRYGRKGVGTEAAPNPLAHPEYLPCPNLPGSAGRFATIERRASLGLPMTHPGDATRDLT